MMETVNERRVGDEALDLLFREARSHVDWLPTPVGEDLLRRAYDLAKLGPTSANTAPARFVFLTTPGAKGRLIPSLKPANIEKTRSAPVTVIVAQDAEFFEHLAKPWPHAPFRDIFAAAPALAAETAMRNSSLQGAYFLLAARALGLDCGPMSGFDAETLDAEFFPDGKWRANFLINLGHGNPDALRPRGPRLDFAEACLVL